MRWTNSFCGALGVLAFGLLPLTVLAQSPDYPPECSPLGTSRPNEPKRPTPETKFIKVKNPIPHRYIVVLKGDAIASDASLEDRRAAITAIATQHASEHKGKVGYIYAAVLKGYSIELPSEAAAIAISEKPEVKWVEEVGLASWASANQESLANWEQFANVRGRSRSPHPEPHSPTPRPE
ncbi:MAG: hypothetical protein QOK48_2264 [Blastocatellia bacterium]|nr:hypothetical protein [Blastocatellia bacterium]